MELYNRLIETGIISAFIVISIFYFNMKESTTIGCQTETKIENKTNNEISTKQNLVEEKKEEIEKEYKNLFSDN